MGLFDVKYNFNNLIRTSSAGVEVSSFVQVKNAITERYKEIYGNDIDVSTETADGQFIMMLSLMLYNGYSSVMYLNQMLDPASANGKWLDVIAGFSNVFRKSASPSYTSVYVKYIGGGNDYTSDFGTNVQRIQFVDKNGKIWTWTEGKTERGFATVFNKVDENNNTCYYPLKVVCEENGAISAFADKDVAADNFVPSDSSLTKENKGDICKTIDESIFPFEVWQAKDAVLGEEDESDQSFKIRRMQEIGNGGITVPNGLIGSLLEILGVKEAKLYENVTGSSQKANDETLINTHDIYLCIRYNENVVDAPIDEAIGKTIHNKLTLGIVTTKSLDLAHNKTYVVQVYKGNLTYNIYWKKCFPLAPSLKLSFKRNIHNYTLEREQVGNEFHNKTFEDKILNRLRTFTKGLTIYDDLNIPNLLSNLNASDIPTNNQINYLFLEGKVFAEGKDKTAMDDSSTSSSQEFKNIDTYYNYDENFYSGYEVKAEWVYEAPSSGSDFANSTLYIYKKLIPSTNN